MPSVTRSLLKGEAPAGTHGRQKRDFMHARDVSRAFLAVLRSEFSGALNIASGEAIAVRDVVTEIAGNINAEATIQFGAIPLPDSEPAVIAADIKALQSLQFTPRMGLARGIKDAVQWWREQ